MNSFLLDTQIVLWAAADPGRLTPTIQTVLTDPAHDIAVSAVSIAEMVVKQSIGKLSLPVAATELCRRLGFDVVDLTAADCEFMSTLPLRHRDPFDRLLIAQCGHSGRALITADRQIFDYAEIDIIRNE